MRDRGCIVVFTKPAVPGKVKTRLIGELTAEQTAALHEAFLGDLVGRLEEGRHEVRLAWALDDGEELPPSLQRGLRQRGRDLGERMFRALSDVSRDHELIAVVGSDHPEMPVARVDEAFSLLAGGSDLVFGPADDGGYYLVAARRDALDAAVFTDIPWSTEAVLETTLERCRSVGARVDLLEVGHDVDTPEDLPRLGDYLRRHPRECPRTLGLFRQWGLLGA